MDPRTRILLIVLGLANGLVALIGAGSAGFSGFALGVMGFAAGLVYFVPAIAGWQRDHFNSTGIFWLNLLLGWLLLPWVGALIWALSRSKAAEVLQQHAELVATGKADAVALRMGATESGPMRECPFCAEQIKAQAKLCRYCRSEVTPIPIADTSASPALPATPPAPPGPTGVCPNCQTRIPLISQRCPKCQADFGKGSTWRVEAI